jgi:hypothetical protein
MKDSQMKIMLSLLILLISATSTIAQSVGIVTATQSNICWLGNTSFSVGSNMHAGNQVMTCRSGGSWVNTEYPAAGCFDNGELFGVGFLVEMSKSDIIIRCTLNGTWEKLETE